MFTNVYSSIPEAFADNLQLLVINKVLRKDAELRSKSTDHVTSNVLRHYQHKLHDFGGCET